MAQLRKGGPVEPEKVNPEDLYEIANRQFWYSTGGPEMIQTMKMQHKLFQATRNKFYKLGGRRSQMAVLEGPFVQALQGLYVEDLDPEEKVLDSKVRKAQKPYGDGLGHSCP